MHEQTALFVICIFSTLIVGCVGYSANTNFQMKLLERMNSLEQQGQQQGEKMRAMESRLEEQERTISDYKQRVSDLEQTVSELKQVNQDPDVGEDQGASNSDGNRSPVITRNGRSINAGNRSASMRMRRALLSAESPVAFHAVIKVTEVDHLGLNQNIVFPNVMMNLGGGYHLQHGVFIAPQPGVYIFSTSIMIQDTAGHDEIFVHLMKNGQILANAGAHADAGRYDQGSVTVVTQLAAADEVWVSLYGPSDTSTYGNYYDSFMGCLIIPL